MGLRLRLEGILLSVLPVEKKHRGQYQTLIMPQRRVKQYTRETLLLKWKATCRFFVRSNHHQAFLHDCNTKHVHRHQVLSVSVEAIVVVDVMFALDEFPNSRWRTPFWWQGHRSGIHPRTCNSPQRPHLRGAKGNSWKTSAVWRDNANLPCTFRLCH